MGHRLDASERGGEQMPMPVRCDARKREQVGGAAGRTRGVPRNSASLLETLRWKTMEQTTENEQEEREAPNRFGSTSSSLREIFVFFALPFL